MADMHTPQDEAAIKALEASYWKAAFDRMAARNIELSAEASDRLSLRDTFIVEKGLWHEFATTVLPSASLSASQKEQA